LPDGAPPAPASRRRKTSLRTTALTLT